MSRIQQITRTDLIEQERHHFDAIAGTRGEVRGPFPVLLNSPDVAERIANVGTYVRFETTLEPSQREIAILTVARVWDCQYEWTAHQPIAEAAGTRPEAIVAIRDRTAPDGLTAEEAVVFNYVHELLSNRRVSESTYESAANMLGTKSLTDLTVTAGYYSMLACALDAFEVWPEEDMEPLLPNASY